MCRIVTEFALHKRREWRETCIDMNTLSFPKRLLEWGRIALDIGVGEDGTPYTGFTVYGLPPDSESEHVEVREPNETEYE